MKSKSNISLQFIYYLCAYRCSYMQWIKQTIIWQLTSKLTFIFPMFTSSSLSSTQESSTMPHTSLNFFLLNWEHSQIWEKSFVAEKRRFILNWVKIFILRIFLFSEYFSFVVLGPAILQKNIQTFCFLYNAWLNYILYFWK